MIALDSLQRRVLDKKNAERMQDRFVERMVAAWRESGQAGMPSAPAMDDPQLRQWIRLAHATCLHQGVPTAPLAVEFTFEVLRAVHLGRDHRFIREMAGYLADRAPDYRGSLDWMRMVSNPMPTQHGQTKKDPAHG